MNFKTFVLGKNTPFSGKTFRPTSSHSEIKLFAGDPTEI